MNLAVKTLPVRRSHAERTALSDARMLDAAVSLIVTRGAAGTTLKEVGELAGYSRGLASVRFGNKAALFAFIVRSVGEEWLATLREAVRDQVGLPAILSATDAHYCFVRDGAERIRAFYSLWFDSIGPDADFKLTIANVHERRQRDIEAWIRSGIAQGSVPSEVPVNAVAQQFCAAIIGIVYQWLVRPEATDHLQDLHIGLKQQMTLARMPVETRRAVFEIGMNAPGEIAPLSRFVAPHAACGVGHSGMSDIFTSLITSPSMCGSSRAPEPHTTSADGAGRF